ncbi:MAG: MCE family protein [Thermodesulfovibrionia bacterium]|nr:MCE family protein [Thermodesulfovibrionia bacterium]
MNSSSTELKVGIFAILVILILTYMTFKVGGLPLIWEKGYRIYVEFDDINGLDEQSRIKIAGVEAGIVEKIRLKDGKAILTLLIDPDVKLYGNATASLKMSGLLGDKHLSLKTGTRDQPAIDNGGTIINTVPAADIGMLANRLTSAASNISDLTGNLKGMLGEDEKEAIRESIHNLRDITENLKEISAENKAPLSRTIAQLDRFTKMLDDRGPDLVENLNETVSELKDMIGENRHAIKSSIENIRAVSESASNIGQKLERGEGTLGKLIEDGKLYDSLSKVTEEAGKGFSIVSKLRTFMDFHAEYDINESDFKGFFDLTLQPEEDHYYILGVITDPRGSVTTTYTTTNGNTVTEEIRESKVEFSAQFARRFDDFVLRIGLIENTFGFGADYFFLKDSGRVRFDMWDFSAKEADADKSHARIGIDYVLFKFIFVSAGADNLLNSNRRGIYVGGGVKFEDKDFKYIFGKSPKISLP